MKIEKKILLTDINQFITCGICKGYLIDATTIPECLHTFCKKCIVEYLEENTCCPICDEELHQSHPLNFIAHDRTLQSIVYKLVANLEHNELERQCKFYSERNLEFPPQLREKLENNASFSSLNKKYNTQALENAIITSVDENSSTALSSVNNDVKKSEENLNDKNVNNKTTSSISSNLSESANDYHRNDEPIALSLEPLEGLQEIKRKYIICSCHSTITHLKKYVARNIYFNIERYKDLDIMCDDQILGKDHTLKFILAVYWKDKELPLRLNFRPKLVF